MRISQLLLPTVKEDPAGWRVMQKFEQIIREEMDAIGCREMLMPVLQPAEIWQESGRWEAIGGEMFRLKDRKGADMVLAMTHEEVITWIAAREVHSCKHLPQLWSHFQTKERDEARPKSVVLRTREFIMKDSCQPRRQRRGAAGELPQAHRRLRPHLQALRCRVQDGRGGLGDDGRRHQPREHGLRRRRRGRDRLLSRVRLRGQRRDGRRGRRSGAPAQ
jgi:tRNA synthetase class II core domain (G, H, P, S and T)